ncbi:MAG: transposase [Bacteroidaceae bacterium]|nr:transposase [Bacteroidaceae bacterium]
MAQSLCKIYLHIIFHIKTVSPPVMDEHLDRLHQYIGHLANTSSCQVIITGGTSDHVHTLVLLSSTENVAHLVEEMKRNSSRWLKSLSSHYSDFAWQSGYAAFSVSQSVVERTMDYIKNQEEHHRKHSFREEYLDFLARYNISYDERYVLSD